MMSFKSKLIYKTHFEDINGFLQTKKMENLKEIERKV
jgi:hypothetical protein